MDAVAPIPRSRREVPIVLTASALLSFASAYRAAALALPDLGFAAFFIVAQLRTGVGAAAPWFVLAAVLVSIAIRRLDLESWALFIPGGLTGRVDAAFGARAATAAASVVIVERILLAALACVVFGHYAASLLFALTGVGRLPPIAAAADLTSFFAIVLLGWLWLRARRGWLLSVARRTQHVWLAVGTLVALAICGALSAGRSWTTTERALLQNPSDLTRAGWWSIVVALAAFGLTSPAIGVGDSLPRIARELEPPRSIGLRRTAALTCAYGLVVTTLLSFLYVALVPMSGDPRWIDAPLIALAQNVMAPLWLRAVLALAVVMGAALLLGQATRAALWGAESVLARLAERNVLAQIFRARDPRFGTYAAAIDTVVVAAAGTIVMSGASRAWLGSAYALSVVATFVLQISALLRLRRLPLGTELRLPLNLRVAGREWAFGTWSLGFLLALSGLALLARYEAGAIGAGVAMAALAFVLATRSGRAVRSEPADLDASQLLPSTELSFGPLEPRPRTILVPVRNPNWLAHVDAALRTSRDHDVVIMMARMIGIDTDEEWTDETHPTASERLVFSRVLALAERYGRSVRLMIVPARDIFDALVAAVQRLHASEVYVGESASISADAQAQLLGQAWERAPRSDLHVRLVIYHRSGRADVYHIGAHAPELNARDLDLIHAVWLDAVKALGQHVHHHDIVRAALTQMAEQLGGPDRDAALEAIRQVAKPADELAAALRTRDYARLRDMVRNRPPSDLGELLAALPLEDQAIVFRLLPRKDAAATFEYLPQDAREALLKTLSKEVVASILNEMAPDDRTMFLEELPAAATRELLSLLTPQERAIALTLLGYPEKSVGRLMTPDYVAVHEEWTVQEVLDYIRRHGQDSETLNVIYVVDDRGGLVDDIRIRAVLLADPSRRVSEIMDRRFVALKATDDQQTAVSVFRQYDRSALPVTDTAGMLIGIVTVDDILDVAETEATKDIQRIGGSEALDEPYMEISFAKMIQKRAGWLTALFVGEMLTATAMGFFEAEISRAVVLALFVPLIISSGGNSGSQASTLVIRALALGEVRLRDWWRVMRRELAAGLALGAILAAIGFMRISIWSAFSDVYGQHWMLVAITVAIALVGIVLWGTLVGSLLPFLLRRLGFDPAASSAPFVATLVDVTGLLIYFSVALIVLHGTLL
jgi:magnesium transporter